MTWVDNDSICWNTLFILSRPSWPKSLFPQLKIEGHISKKIVALREGKLVNFRKNYRLKEEEFYDLQTCILCHRRLKAKYGFLRTKKRLRAHSTTKS